MDFDLDRYIEEHCEWTEGRIARMLKAISAGSFPAVEELEMLQGIIEVKRDMAELRAGPGKPKAPAHG